ncbi:MAG: DUF2183 domain-containing protein [Thermoguttaceae bacterium]|nr:DUF2183 domain-containing protein [Thermoguttaceae bacterium]MDW8038568.1 DUF2183 domain-containing protein [Thermoguttaceae bacterium]
MRFLTLVCLLAQIRADETVVFYPSFSYEHPTTEQWEGYIHGVIYEPEKGSWWRWGVIAMVGRTLHIPAGSPEAQILQERLWQFLADGERGKEIRVRLGDRTVSAGISGPDGYFRSWVRISAAEARRLATQPGGWIRYTALLPSGDSRILEGRMQLIGPKGLSIISDIDDTIKHTQMLDAHQMLLNSLVRPFRPVEGMAELYQEAAKRGAVVHYVSASPWQLFVPLEEFRQKTGFPAGSFHLQQVRFDPGALAQIFSGPKDFKITQITQILKLFPQRRFILVGDSGQQDPEVYGELARKYPQQVVAIWIRNITSEPANSPRYQKAFAQLPPSVAKVFENPEELRPELKRILVTVSQTIPPSEVKP